MGHPVWVKINLAATFPVDFHFIANKADRISAANFSLKHETQYSEWNLQDASPTVSKLLARKRGENYKPKYNNYYFNVMKYINLMQKTLPAAGTLERVFWRKIISDTAKRQTSSENDNRRAFKTTRKKFSSLDAMSCVFFCFLNVRQSKQTTSIINLRVYEFSAKTKRGIAQRWKCSLCTKFKHRLT